MCNVVQCPMCGRGLKKPEKTKRYYVFKCECGTVVRVPKKILDFYESFCKSVKEGDSSEKGK